MGDSYRLSASVRCFRASQTTGRSPPSNGDKGQNQTVSSSDPLPSKMNMQAHSGACELNARPKKPPSDIEIFVFRSEEHTSELQSLMRISYAVFCLKKKKI